MVTSYLAASLQSAMSKDFRSRSGMRGFSLARCAEKFAVWLHFALYVNTAAAMKCSSKVFGGVFDCLGGQHGCKLMFRDVLVCNRTRVCVVNICIDLLAGIQEFSTWRLGGYIEVCSLNIADDLCTSSAVDAFRLLLQKHF